MIFFFQLFLTCAVVLIDFLLDPGEVLPFIFRETRSRAVEASPRRRLVATETRGEANAGSSSLVVLVAVLGGGGLVAVFPLSGRRELGKRRERRATSAALLAGMIVVSFLLPFLFLTGDIWSFESMSEAMSGLLTFILLTVFLCSAETGIDLFFPVFSFGGGDIVGGIFRHGWRVSGWLFGWFLR